MSNLKTALGILVLCVMTLSARMSSAQSVNSETISYQGQLVDAANKPVPDGMYRVKVALKDLDNGDSVLWSDIFETMLTNGIYNIAVGSQKPLPPPFAMDKDILFSVAIDNGPELPGTKLSAVPFAINVVDSSITSAKMATDYISSISVNGQKVTGVGSKLNIIGNVAYDDATKSIVLNSGGSTTDSSGKGASTQIHNGAGIDYWGEALNTLTGAGNPRYPSEFLGTSNDYEVGIMTNGVLGLQIVPTSGVPSVFGGDAGNYSTFEGAFVGGGYNNGASTWGVVCGGSSNHANTQHSFVGGGYHNMAGTNVDDSVAVVCGGYWNWVEEEYSSIVGGDSNSIHSQRAFIGGGRHNVIESEDNAATQAHYSSIVGGAYNLVGTQFAFIGGGESNNIASDANNVSTSLYNSIVGGMQNVIEGDAPNLSIIGGGYRNRIHSDSMAAIVAGDSNKIFNGADRSIVGAGFNNSIASPASAILGGDMNKIDTLADHAVIGGGQLNTIDTSGKYSSILGGRFNNIVKATYSAIVGGDTNKIDSGANYSAIGGGLHNYVQGPFCVIAGGEKDSIRNILADHNVIGGGLGNIEDNPSDGVIAGGWQNFLDVGAWGSTIAGGDSNNIHDALDFIGSGSFNMIHEYAGYSVICGGSANTVQGNMGIIVGGDSNHTNAGPDGYATIVGGKNNSVFGRYGFLGGGLHNTIGWGADSSALVGGTNNSIGNSAIDDFLGGGSSNTILDTFDFLGGGENNTVAGNWASIVGGYMNVDSGLWATIAGGAFNTIGTAASDGFIGGGLGNQITTDGLPELSGSAGGILAGSANKVRANDGAIGAGVANTVDGQRGFIGAGVHNHIDTAGSNSVIVNGDSNYINNQQDVIMSGYRNQVLNVNSVIGSGNLNNAEGYSSFIGTGNSNLTLEQTIHLIPHPDTTFFAGDYEDIPGGDHLTAQSYAQTVIGHYNVLQGASINDTLHNPDDQLLIIGNGNRVTGRSNAFTVSDTGYATVYDNIGTGGGLHPTSTRMGTMYANNELEAWANCPGGGGGTTADIGVASVTWFPADTDFVVELNVKNQDGTSRTFTAGNGSITTSIDLNLTGGPGIIYASQLLTSGPPGITATTPGFTISTMNLVSGARTNTYKFQFHVALR